MPVLLEADAHDIWLTGDYEAATALAQAFDDERQGIAGELVTLRSSGRFHPTLRPLRVKPASGSCDQRPSSSELSNF